MDRQEARKTRTGMFVPLYSAFPSSSQGTPPVLQAAARAPCARGCNEAQRTTSPSERLRLLSRTRQRWDQVGNEGRFHAGYSELQHRGTAAAVPPSLAGTGALPRRCHRRPGWSSQAAGASLDYLAGMKPQSVPIHGFSIAEHTL